jgi:hypothetical protein
MFLHKINIGAFLGGGVNLTACSQESIPSPNSPPQRMHPVMFATGEIYVHFCCLYARYLEISTVRDYKLTLQMGLKNMCIHQHSEVDSGGASSLLCLMLRFNSSTYMVYMSMVQL